MIFDARCAYNTAKIKMGVNMRGKIHIQNRGGQKQKIKIRYVMVAVVALMITWVAVMPHAQTRAETCPSLRVVFARGSGGERWTDQNYLAFKEAIENKLRTVELDYEFIDLDYPAVGIGIDKLDVTAGAIFGSGEAYEFGASVDTGTQNLTNLVNGSCPGTKYVVGGYSQGAMVVSKSLKSLNADNLIYAATFGDPKIYLPEGEGVFPAACRGENLSDYRAYVPDCQAYKGMLGAYIPYEPTSLADTVGTWCNNKDIFCSSKHLHLGGMVDHTSYIKDNLYEDASRVIFDKICGTFGLENRVSSPHDTAILIDSTGSMMGMLGEYKAEALRLATETLESGGRVALFDYRDLDDPYDLVQHCGFEDCTLEVFEEELGSIRADGGGDDPESLLSASFHTMEALNWKQGSTKSLVILTDANFLSPDRDGMTFDEVVALSKRIDPVNFYIITTAEYGVDYAELAEATDGKVVTDFDELSLLTDYIMERYDSLPRVEEGATVELPVLEIVETAQAVSEVKVKFANTGSKAIVMLNDRVLGVTDETEVTITGLDMSKDNVVGLVPINDEVRGETVMVKIAANGYGQMGGGSVNSVGNNEAGLIESRNLKVPATGRR